MEDKSETEEQKLEAWKKLITQNQAYETPFNPVSKILQKKACHLCWKLDVTDPCNEEEIAAITKELLPCCTGAFKTGRGFKCDYGFNIHNKGFVLLNGNVTILDTSPVYFGNQVMVGPGTVIACAGHGIEPENRGINTSAPINIEDNVWIGANCTITAGVTIGSGSLIAAGAVVTENIPSNVLAGGVPAKVIRKL